jgi:hypothetical protein
MSLYELHHLLFDLRSYPEVKEEYGQDREAVYQRYTLSDDELAALRTDDIYRLHRLGVNAYLLAPYAQILGFELMELGDILRADAEAERQRQAQKE